MKCAKNKPAYLFRNDLEKLAVNPLFPASKTFSVNGQLIHAVSGVHHENKRPVVSNFLTNCWGAQLTSAHSEIMMVESDYRSNYGLIDHFNQITMANKYPHRHSNFLAAIFDFVLSVSLQNAHVIYTQTHHHREPLREFIKHVYQELSPDPKSTTHIIASTGMHRHCAQCRTMGKSSSTSLCCSTCFRQPPLHQRCFALYHEAILFGHQ